MDRRTFLLASAFSVLSFPESGEGASPAHAPRQRARVGLVKDAPSREWAVKKAIDLLAANPVRGKHVLLKPNFNTADPFPASTHNETLRGLILKLGEMGARSVTVGERAGPPRTGSVLDTLGIRDLCRETGAGLIDFEELPEKDWLRIRPPASHWRDGFRVARPVLEAEAVVCTCCCKTHQYGGVFTMALKLAVGITHKGDMAELHGSRHHMRRMIAEINQAYTPVLTVMDASEVFTDGGPMTGTRKSPGVMVAGADRLAIDAVGLAILKEAGANRHIMERPVFAQEQMVRAVELGLGISDPSALELATGDQPSARYAALLEKILGQETA